LSSEYINPFEGNSIVSVGNLNLFSSIIFI